MAVAKTGAAGSGNSAAGPLTYSYTVAADADCLVVGVSIGFNDVSVGTVTGVTYNGVAMTQVVVASDTSGPYNRAYLFRLVAPATGANNVVVSTTGSITGIVSGAQGFKGVDQTTPISNSNGANGNGATLAVSVTSASGEWTIDTASGGAVDLGSPTQTQDWLTDRGSNGNGGGSDAAGAASVAFQWSQTADVWAHVALSLKAAAGGPTPYQPWIQRAPLLAQ